MRIRITPRNELGIREIHLWDGKDWNPFSPNGEYWESDYTEAAINEGKGMITLEID